MIRTFFAAAISFAAFTPLFASALSPVQPELIRGPDSSTVYYALRDGRRFTFPNERIYQSWYRDFSRVESLTKEELASYKLAGAVVYHPGTLLKITTDPKVYAVTEHGVLRWLETESVARRVGGSGWASLVHDLPDELFPAYTIGAPVPESDLSFSLAPLLTKDETIATNQRLVENTPQQTPSAPTSTQAAPLGDIILRTSDSRGVLPADSITISAFGSGRVPEHTRVYVNNLLVRSCVKALACSHTFTHPTQSSIQAYTIRAEGSFLDGSTVVKTLLVPVRDPQAGALRLLLSNTQGRINTPIDLRAEWKDSLIGTQRIQLLVDGLEQKVCFSGTVCTVSFPLTKPVGQQYVITATADDTSGTRWTSPAVNIQIVANEAPTLNTGINSTVLYVGESIEINARASDDDVITDMSLWRNGVRVQSCVRSACAYRSEPTTEPKEEQFRVTATDSNGNTTEYLFDPIMVLPRLPS